MMLSVLDPVCSSVLGVDFYVTQTVYEHKLLVNKSTGTHPNFVGPTLVHQDCQFGTYLYIASQLKKIRPKIGGLVAYGIDREEALSSAFSSVYPGINFTDANIGYVSRERLRDMWDKAEQLLSTPNLVLPSAGATQSARQVASLSSIKSKNKDPPHFVTTNKKKEGTEDKCDCPVYKSSPSIMSACHCSC